MTELTARQAEIIEAAIRLIHRGGIQHVTMKNIARQLGISEPAIYRHFESKMDILLSMLAQFKQRSGDHLRRARSLNVSGLQRLETIFLEHSEQFATHPHMTAIVFSEEAFQDDKRLSEAVFSVMRTAHDTVADIIAQTQQNREIRCDIPKEHLTLIILGTLRMMVKRWRLSAYSFDLKKERLQVWKSLKTLLESQAD